MTFEELQAKAKRANELVEKLDILRMVKPNSGEVVYGKDAQDRNTASWELRVAIIQAGRDHLIRETQAELESILGNAQTAAQVVSDSNSACGHCGAMPCHCPELHRHD